MTGVMTVERCLAACAPARVSPMSTGRLVSARGTFLKARGLTCAVGTGALVEPGIRAEVIGFEGGEAVLIAFHDDVALRPGARVEAARSSAIAMLGSSLLGRVIDAEGMPVDGRGPILGETRRNVAGSGSSTALAGSVLRRFDTGVRAIDGLMTLGRGQRVMLAAGSGVGKSTLIRQIVAGANVDICVVALVGERNREIADFVGAMREMSALRRTITVAVPGDRSPLLRIRAAQRATATAEYFREQGRNVLLIVDSLTRVAHAQRELGLGLGETPTMKGYPPSALALIPALLERCGNRVDSGGSVTALYTVLADGDDIDDPVVDATRAIADGHIMLSRSLAEQGIFPAIDIGRSLSRVMGDIATPAHNAAAARVRRLWAVAEDNRDLALMGAYRPGTDPLVDEAMAARGPILDFVGQARDAQEPADHAIARLIETFAA